MSNGWNHRNHGAGIVSRHDGHSRRQFTDNLLMHIVVQLGYIHCRALAARLIF
jgi:hypothetical protein